MTSLYSVVAGAARRAAVYIDAVYADARVAELPYYKEVHIVVGGRLVVSVKVSERRWATPPSLLARWARGLLRRGKSLARVVVPVLIASRLTWGSLRLLSGRLRWLLVAFHTTLTEGRLALLLRMQLERLLSHIPGLRSVARLAERIVERLATETSRSTRGEPKGPPWQIKWRWTHA